MSLGLKKIIRFKVYYDRGGIPYSYAKTLLIIAMAYKLWEDAEIGVWIEGHLFVFIPSIVIGYIVTRIIWGYFDKKLKLREYEIAEYNKTDPNLRKILKDLQDIKHKLDDNSTDSQPPRTG